MRLLALIVALLVGVGVAPAPAAAKGEEAKAKKLFSKGNRAFDEGRYSDALASYRESYDLVARPSTLFNIATCRDRLGDTEGAFVDYERFVAAEQPEAPLVTEARKRLDELRATLELPVSVSSSPAGARIRIDGADTIVAQTPAELMLSLGTHVILLDAPQHRGAERTVEVVAGARARVDVTLIALGTVVLSADPPEATITLATAGDGVEIAGAPGRLTRDLEPGTYAVTVRHEGHREATITLEVVGGAVMTRHIALQPIVVAKPEPPPPPRHIDRGQGLRTAGIISAVAGVVTIGVGVQQGLAAKGASDDAQHAATDGRWDPMAYDAARGAELRMFVLYGVGAAALVAGGVLYYLGASRSDVLVTPTSDGGAVIFSTTF